MAEDRVDVVDGTGDVSHREVGGAGALARSGGIGEAGDGGAARRAQLAVATIFLVNGAMFANWVARVPAVKDHVGAGAGSSGWPCWGWRAARWSPCRWPDACVSGSAAEKSSWPADWRRAGVVRTGSGAERSSPRCSPRDLWRCLRTAGCGDERPGRGCGPAGRPPDHAVVRRRVQPRRPGRRRPPELWVRVGAVVSRPLRAGGRRGRRRVLSTRRHFFPDRGARWTTVAAYPGAAPGECRGGEPGASWSGWVRSPCAAMAEGAMATGTPCSCGT